LATKSRRNRRSVTPKSKIDSGLNETVSIPLDVSKSIGKPNKISVPTAIEKKGIGTIKAEDSNFIQELKWISITTGIVLVFLAISYIVFYQ
jgi:hypothetical protein